jgi:hypothetical protein
MRAVANQQGEALGINDAPRVLRVTYEFYIPKGTPGNVRTDRRRAAVASMTAAVKAIAQDELPHATAVTVHQEWMYRWDDKTVTHCLLPPGTTTDPADQNAD